MSKFGFKLWLQIPLVELAWLGSWDSPSYSRWGMWTFRRGITLRYRAWLLHLGLRVPIPAPLVKPDA